MLRPDWISPMPHFLLSVHLACAFLLVTLTSHLWLFPSCSPGSYFPNWLLFILQISASISFPSRITLPLLLSLLGFGAFNQYSHSLLFLSFSRLGSHSWCHCCLFLSFARLHACRDYQWMFTDLFLTLRLMTVRLCKTHKHTKND